MMLLKLSHVLVIGSLLISQGAFASCKIFEHANYQGENLLLDNGDEIENLDDYDWNDILSSIKITDQCTLVGHEHVNMQGELMTFNRNTRYVGDEWNDRISSVSCHCEGIGQYVQPK